MTVTARVKTLALLLCLTAAAMAGCKRKEAAPKPGAAPAAEAPAPVPADAAAPFAYAAKSPQAEVSLKLPAILARQPDLHARLYSEGVRDLKAFAEGAQEDHGEEGADLPPYTREVEWQASGETGKLLTLRKQTYEYTGGAHPNSVLDALVWDKAMKRQIAPASLFRAKADFAALDAALCEAVTAARRERVGADFQPDPQSFPCPKWRESTYVLAPSSSGGKAGGLTFLFSPYAVGAYAEGPYEITVPLSVFQAALAPAYADEFDGAPARVGDVTPKT
jgi:hypothetical protein